MQDGVNEEMKFEITFETTFLTYKFVPRPPPIHKYQNCIYRLQPVSSTTQKIVCSNTNIDYISKAHSQWAVLEGFKSLDTDFIFFYTFIHFSLFFTILILIHGCKGKILPRK